MKSETSCMDSSAPAYPGIGIITFLLALLSFSLIFSIAAAHILLGLSLLVWCYQIIINRERGLDWTPLKLPLLLYVLISLLSSLTSSDVPLSLYSFKEMLLFVILFLVVNNLKRFRQIDFVYKACFCGMALGAAYGLVNYLFFSSGGLVSRVGVFHHYLTTAELLMMALLLLIGRFLFYHDRWTPILVPAALLILAGLVFTYARSAWIGFTGGIILLFFLRKPALLVLIPFLLLLIYILSPDEVEHRIRSIFDRNDPTVSERLFFYQSGIAMIRDHPLLGVGPDLANDHYPAYRMAGAPDRPIPHLHSNVIQIGAERGLLGLLAWFFFFGRYFIDGWRSWRRSKSREKRYITAGSMAAVTAMMLAGLFEYNFGDSEIQMMTFLVMSTLYVLLKERERGNIDACDESLGNAEGGSNHHS